MEHLDPDQLVLLALGERSGPAVPHPAPPAGGSDHRDDVAPDGDAHHDEQSAMAHLQDCARCRYELAHFSHTVELAREGGELGLQDVVLPPSIWSGIAHELGIGIAAEAPGDPSLLTFEHPDIVPAPEGLRGATSNQPPDPAVGQRLTGRSSRSRRGRPVFWRSGLLAAAAVVVVGAGIGVGVVIGRHDTTTSIAVTSQADLAPVQPGLPTASGTATITQNPGGLVLNVTAQDLPLRQGYYEVWLFDPVAGQMVPIGLLGAGGHGFWTLPPTLDLRTYSVVNVSAQDFDGNPAHKNTVLQGALTQ